LPLTLPLARRMLEQQRKLKALSPELGRIKKRYRDDRTKLGEATLALYRKHDIEVFPRGTFKSMALQMPLGAALYQAVSTGLGRGVRFLWIRDLAAPDIVVAA